MPPRSSGSGARFRVVFSWPTRILIAVGAAVSAFGVVAEAGDGRGARWWAGVLTVGAACLPTAWAVLETLWRPDPAMPAPMAALNRSLLVPLLAAPVIAVVDAVVVLLPPVSAAIAASRMASGWHYYFPAGQGAPPFQLLVLGGLINIVAAMLTGVALTVLVVLPAIAFRRPREFADANMLDGSKRNAADNRTAGRFFSILLILVLVIPTAIVIGSGNASAESLGELAGTCWRVFVDPGTYWGDGLWAFGILLIPVGLVALVIIATRQHPDVRRRSQAGVSALIPSRRDDEEPDPTPGAAPVSRPDGSAPAAPEPGNPTPR